MCHPRVTDLLVQHVKDSEATVVFLNIMRDVIDSFLDPNITPLERVRKIWQSIFIIRIWRQFIKSHKQYTLKDNFLTSNCYACLELNAHSLILCMLHLQKIKRSDLFLPLLFESQPCESMFRQIRSFSPMSSTVTNCTTKAALSIISKTQLQNQIVHETSPFFVYPRLGNDDSTNTVNKFSLPTSNEIIGEIEKCKHNAIITAHKLGLIPNRRQNNYACEVPLYTSSDRSRNRKVNVSYNPFVSPNLQNIKLKNFANNLDKDITSDCPYVGVIADDGELSVYKKTSLCWLWGKDRNKLSSDRLKRVQYKDNSSKKKKKNRTNFAIYTSKNVRKK